MNKSIKKMDILKYSAFFLLLVLSVTLFISSCLYYVHISLSKFHFLGSIVISGCLLYIIKKYLKISSKTVLYSILVGLIVIFTSVLLMTFIYDRSSDGNTYHKDAIGNFYLGWNPVYEESHDFVEKEFKNNSKKMHDYDIWKDHYAKANWILEASVYKLTDHIESGKAINVILMYILFAFVFVYFYQKIGWKAILLSLAVTFNPISCNQMFTFYNDQLGASLFFLLVLILIKICDKKDKSTLVEKYGSLFLVFPIITNIKFNIMGYAMVFTCAFMLLILFYKYKEKKFLPTFKKLVIYYIVVFIISFGIIGYPTYIKNYIDHGNSFYPVYGEDSEDIITAQQPKDFLKKNTMEKFFIATFAKTNNLQHEKEYELKIPFTVSKTELKESMGVDTRLSGYGVLFSGLFCLSIIILIFYLIKTKNKEMKVITILLLGLTALIILIISESWWARYNPTTYLVLLSALYILLKEAKKEWIPILFTILVGINSGIIFGGNLYYNVQESIKIEKDLNKLKGKDINIKFNRLPVTGIVYNLKDYDINYKFKTPTNPKVTYYKYLEYEVTNENK